MKNRMLKMVTPVLAAALLVGSAIPAFADGSVEGSAEGKLNYEGTVGSTSAFKVSVPTDASQTGGFDFIIDPNGLLSSTNYAARPELYGKVDDSKKLFFRKTVPDSTTNNTYGPTSDSLTLINMSSYPVNYEIAAKVEGATGITLATADTDITAATTDPSLYLALSANGKKEQDDGSGGKQWVADSQTKALDATGIKVSGQIPGQSGNFTTVYTENGYAYVQKTSGLTNWEEVSFNLTGACGGEWGKDEAKLSPKVTVTWKVTDPNAVPAVPSASVTTVKASELTSGKVIDITLGASTTAITALQWSANENSGFKEFSAGPTGNGTTLVLDPDAKTLTIGSGYATSTSADRYLRVIFDNDNSSYVQIHYVAGS